MIYQDSFFKKRLRRKNIGKIVDSFLFFVYSLEVKWFDNQTIWNTKFFRAKILKGGSHSLSHSIEQINSYLVSIFNEVLDIEEDALRTSNFTDLSISEMHTLEAIGMYSEHTSSEVAKKLSITAGTLSVAINSLVKKDYVVRQRMENDRRVIKLGLTKKGKLVYRLHEKFHREMVKRTIEGMDDEEVEVLLRGLSNLHSFLFELVESIGKR